MGIVIYRDSDGYHRRLHKKMADLYMKEKFT